MAMQAFPPQPLAVLALGGTSLLARLAGVAGLMESSEHSCWGGGYSRATCCLETPILPCFVDGSGLTAEKCCGRSYDYCFMVAVVAGSRWRAQDTTCADYAQSSESALSRDCLTWWQGDVDFEQSVVADTLAANIARCFHVNVWRGKLPPANTSRRAPRARPRSIVGAEHMQLGVCVPHACSEKDIAADPFAFMDIFRLSSGRFKPGGGVEADAAELWTWRALGERIDFVIAGFPNSGSSTLAQTLSAHPDVEMITGRDGDREVDMPAAQSSELEWESWLCAELLPRKWVEEVIPERTPGKLRGLKNPLLLYSKRCAMGLARSMLKVLIIVRDPLEWLLSVLGHDIERFGYSLVDYIPGHPGFFGRNHARFGTILSDIMDLWAPGQILALELEHLRHEGTARIALDAVYQFLGVSPFALHVDGAIGTALKYDKGLGTSSSRWSLSRLCTVGNLFDIHTIGEGLAAEYEKLPRALAWIGVPELGVSTTLLRGGIFVRSCDMMERVPTEGTALSGWPERHAAEKLIRVDLQGELGYEFEAQVTVRLNSLGCGAGSGPLKRSTHMTLWEAHSRQPVWVGTVGPESMILDGYAFTRTAVPPIVLKAGRVYALTVQVFPGLGISVAGHTFVRLQSSFTTYRGAVFSRAAWTYPTERDENASELVYVNLAAVSFH